MLAIEHVAIFVADVAARHVQGLGRRLMAIADDHARALGLGAVELYTNEAMTENLT